MKYVITTGRTIEDAVLSAAIQLAVQRDKLNIEILEEPVKGLFGIFGGTDAKIKASVQQKSADLAKGFLSDLLDKMGIEGKLDVTEADNVISLNVSGPKMGVLIGHRGDTLDAVQYLTSLIVNRDSDKYKRIFIDTENYRSKREETLKKLARRLATKVHKSGRKFTLEPMNPFERRIIHSTLQNDSNVTTHSEGSEPYRKVVITVK
ncbi:MAG TPA: RNA-binding cell elongation regulator Jag/EloR [Bacillota bacterium]|nr:RNA-binding cell elongation regulator Jag/EloR [Bacillota bacterium]